MQNYSRKFKCFYKLELSKKYKSKVITFKKKLDKPIEVYIKAFQNWVNIK